MRASVLAFAAFLALTAGCKKPKQDGAPDSSVEAPGGPKITVHGSEVQLDGEIAGTTRAIEDLGRLQRVDELFNRLKTNRETFKTQNPDKPFPGEATIGVDPAAPSLVFKSVFQTAAYAGYPFLNVDTGESQLVRLSAIIPGPSSENLPPRIQLHVRVSDEKGVELEEKRADTAPSLRVISPSLADADLQVRVKTAIVDELLRRDVRANPVIQVVLHAENRLPFSTLTPVLRGLRDAHTRLAGPNDSDDAFSLELGIN